MRRQYVRRADGRYAVFYDAESPLGDDGLVVGELARLVGSRQWRVGPELRWNVLRGEWTIVAGQRMNRPLTIMGDSCLLCPGSAELPERYAIACFENRFPSFLPGLPDSFSLPTPDGPGFTTTRATGLCEVVVFTPEHAASLGSLPVGRIERVIAVFADRCRELAALPGIEYVFPFENRGAAVGVTLHHPHGQIYAFPYLPPVLETEWTQARALHRAGQCLFCAITASERADGRRIVAEDESFTAFVPFAARYPYEVQIVSRRHGAAALPDLSAVERASLASVLALVLRKYDNLFGFPLPYLLMFHQAPARIDGAADCWHLHVELYPVQRSRDKLKYRASVETGAGSFINDAYPEEKAAELRAVGPGTLADLTDSSEGKERR